MCKPRAKLIVQNFKLTNSYIQARKAALAKSREQERKELNRLKRFCSCICVHLFFYIYLYLSLDVPIPIFV